MEPAPQSVAVSVYPVLCCSPRHLGLIPYAEVESESAAPDAGHVAASVAIPMAVAVAIVTVAVLVPASPSPLDL